MERTCLRCGVDISHRHGNRKYCSPACQQRGRWGRTERIPCSQCGGPSGWKSSDPADPATVRCRNCRSQWQHGTRKGYRDAGCRCDECRQWNRSQMADYNADRKRRDPEYRTAAGGRDRSGEYREYTASMRRRDERRRARKVRAPFDDFDSAEIYERDGWVCGICSDPVDHALTYPDPMSASLDHIEPLSLGGSHTRDNSRCAHLRCNIRRGNRVA